MYVSQECNYCGPAHKLDIGPWCIYNVQHVFSRLTGDCVGNECSSIEAELMKQGERLLTRLDSNLLISAGILVLTGLQQKPLLWFCAFLPCCKTFSTCCETTVSWTTSIEAVHLHHRNELQRAHVNLLKRRALDCSQHQFKIIPFQTSPI